jgi:hypothetical protein
MNAMMTGDATPVFEQNPPEATPNNVVVFSDRAFVHMKEDDHSCG